MQKRTGILFCSLFAFTLIAGAQSLDSLKRVVGSRSHDTLKLQALSDLSWLYSDRDISLARKYARDEIRLASKIRNEKWESQAYNDLGIVHYKKGDMDSALHYYYKSLDIRRKINDKALIGSSLSKIGVVEGDLGHYRKSLEHHFEALAIFEKIGNQQYVAMTLNNIGLNYDKLKNYDKEIEYVSRAVDMHLKSGNEYLTAACYGNLGSAYKMKGDLKKSNECLQKALKIFAKYGDATNEAGVLNSIGLNLRAEKRNQEALDYYRRAYDVAVRMQDKVGVCLYSHNMSGVLLDLGKYAEAKKYGLIALEHAENSNYSQRLFSYRQLATIYGYLNDGVKARHFLDLYANLKDKMFSRESAKQVAEAEIRYQSEKTRRKLAENEQRNSENELKLESRRKWLTLAFTLAVLLGGVTIWVYRSQSIRRRNEKREYELNKKLETAMLEKGFAEEKIRISRELHDNIGSHLTFMISSLDNLSYDKDPLKKLEKISELSNFGRITMKDLRDTIWAMNHDGGTVEQLLTRISELRSVLPDELNVDIANSVPADRGMNGLQLLNCFRIVQEFIQNTIKYAGADKISIGISGDEENFVLRISDNGRGFDATSVNLGNGLLNMRRRCEDLHGKFAIVSSSEGTAVTCIIPWKIEVGADLQVH